MSIKIYNLVDKFKREAQVCSLDQYSEYIPYEDLVKSVIRECVMIAVRATDDPERMLDAFKHEYGRW